MIRAENDISEIDAHYSAKLGAITERLEELNSYIQTLMSTCDDSLVKIGLSAFLGGNSSDKISDKKKNELIKNFEAEHKEEAEKLQNKDYQRELSEIIFESLKEYFINIGKLKKEEISLILSD